MLGGKAPMAEEKASCHGLAFVLGQKQAASRLIQEPSASADEVIFRGWALARHGGHLDVHAVVGADVII
jgi:hypothetical protein